jgi:hypothetical protein
VFCLVVCVCFSNSWELNKCYRSFGRLQPTRMCQDFDWGGGGVVGSRSMGGGGGPLQLCLISSRRERKIMELFSDMMSKFTCPCTLLLAGKG